VPFHPTPIHGLQLFEPRIFGDKRGYFFESYNQKTFTEAGINNTFVQDNQALSPKGVLRGLHFQTRLSGENNHQLFIPAGFAHGYLVLSETALFAYKCDNYYDPSAEGGFRYDDPAIGIEWPELEVDFLVAERDLGWASLG